MYISSYCWGKGEQWKKKELIEVESTESIWETKKIVIMLAIMKIRKVKNNGDEENNEWTWGND